jgi:transposase InsO family protein
MKQRWTCNGSQTGYLTINLKEQYTVALQFMKQDVTAYMKYYNLERLHSVNGDLSPVEFENSQLKVSSLAWPVQPNH